MPQSYCGPSAQFSFKIPRPRGDIRFECKKELQACYGHLHFNAARSLYSLLPSFGTASGQVHLEPINYRIFIKSANTVRSQRSSVRHHRGIALTARQAMKYCSGRRCTSSWALSISFSVTTLLSGSYWRSRSISSSRSRCSLFSGNHDCATLPGPCC